MSDHRTDLPSPNAPNFNQRLRETIQTYLGRQGNPLDRGLTLRDLIETGVLKIREGFQLKPGAGSSIPLQPGDGVVDVYEPDLTPPPTPAGLTATAAISHVLIEHAAPVYTQGHGHLRTRLYGKIVNTGDPLPTFADAAEIGQFSGTVYAHPSNPATTWRFWTKWETMDNVLSIDPAGGTNGVEAITGQDVSKLVKAMTGPGNPFKVVTEELTLPDGTVVPVGTYTADAFIHNGQITNAKIANLAVDSAKIASVSADKITAGSIAVGQHIQSAGYAAGSSGWRINGDGNAEFGAASIRGQLTASQIDTRGLSIKDASGNVILAAGNALNWSMVGGTGKPADGATRNEIYSSNIAPSYTFVGSLWLCTADAQTYKAIGTVSPDVAVISAGQFINCTSLASSQDIIVLPFGSNEAVFSELSSGTLVITNNTPSVLTGALVNHSLNTGMVAYKDFVYFTNGYTTTTDIAKYMTDGTPFSLTTYSTAPANTANIFALASYKKDVIYRATGSSWVAYSTMGAPTGTYVGDTLAQDVESQASAQSRADAAANWAVSAAQIYAEAQANLATISAQAYADGVITAAEQRAIDAATEKANAAKADAIDAAAADASAKADLAATTANWSGVTGAGKPADGATNGSNLIKKGTFDDGQPGSWGYAGIENRINAGMPYAKNIYFHARDNLENDADFDVTPGEVLYGSAWLETSGISSYACYLGVRISDATGAVIGWNIICGIGPDTSWTYVKGSTVVPAGGVKAVPWVTLSGFDFPANYQWLRAAGLYIGRHEQGATVGANSSNLKVGLGVNMLPNSNFLNGSLEGWTNGGSDNRECATGLGGWTLSGNEGTAYIRQLTGYTEGWYGDLYATRVPVVAGARYEAFAYTGSHRALLHVVVAWYNTSGNWISEHAVGGNDEEASGGTTLSGYKKTGGFAVAPTDAATALFFVRKYSTKAGYVDSWAFVSRAFFGEALPGQTELSPWSPGPVQGVRALGYSGDLNATYGATASQIAAIASKLNKSGDDIMTGSVKLASQSAIWFGNSDSLDSNNGVYIGSSGLVGRKGGNTTFAIGADGSATFGGTLNVASATSGERMEITNSVIKVYDAAGVLRVKLGNLA